MLPTACAVCHFHLIAISTNVIILDSDVKLLCVFPQSEMTCKGSDLVSWINVINIEWNGAPRLNVIEMNWTEVNFNQMMDWSNEIDIIHLDGSGILGQHWGFIYSSFILCWVWPFLSLRIGSQCAHRCPPFLLYLPMKYPLTVARLRPCYNENIYISLMYSILEHFNW